MNFHDLIYTLIQIKRHKAYLLSPTEFEALEDTINYLIIRLRIKTKAAKCT